jgi:translation initiation factor 4E
MSDAKDTNATNFSVWCHHLVLQDLLNPIRIRHLLYFSLLEIIVSPRVMNSYFSNYSQSRFPTSSHANVTNSSSTTTTVTAPTKPTGVPSSGRFSTSVSMSSIEDKLLVRDKSHSGNGTPASVHPLRNTYVRAIARSLLSDSSDSVHSLYSWVFWFRQQRAPGNKTLNYEEGIKKVAAFSSVRPSLA